jgi:hypothetical protein
MRTVLFILPVPTPPSCSGSGNAPLSTACWDALAAENRRLWDAYYRLRPAYEPWEGWQQWITEYRTLVATAQEVYEAQYGKKRDDSNVEP